MKVIFLILSFITVTSALAVEVTPTQLLNQSIAFTDDLQFENLDLAIERQLQSFERAGLKGQIRFGSTTYSKSVLKDSLLLLGQFVNEARTCLKNTLANLCLSKFNRDINTEFNIYVPVPAKGEEGRGKKATTKYTSYYSPDLHGSRTRTERFKNPIYRQPDLASERNFTRVEIDYKGALAGKGYEIFWVEESFYDLYLLHVQGGGRINIYNPDGTKEVKYLSYDGKNSRAFQMIYHYMIKQGYLQADATGIPAQRRFLEEHPDKAEEIFGVCPSYIYFKETSEEPVGLDNIPLTDGRSLAIDNSVYKSMGMINFVKTMKASYIDARGNVVKVPFSRFFISQDKGGSIRGNARCDLYFGYGPLAELTAYNLNDFGEQYFLIKK